MACQLSRDGLDIGSVPVNTGPMFIMVLRQCIAEHVRAVPKCRSPATDAAAGTEGAPAPERSPEAGNRPSLYLKMSAEPSPSSWVTTVETFVSLP